MATTLKADDILPEMAAHPVEDRLAVLERQVLKLTQAMAGLVGSLEVGASIAGKRMNGDET